MAYVKRTIAGKLTIALAAIFVMASGSALGLGEKYSEQGKELGAEIYIVLNKYGYCEKRDGCSGVLFGEHGNRVNIHLYGLTDMRIIGAVVGYVAERGMDITKGVPITIEIYREQKEKTTGFRSFIVDPFIVMEINKQ